MDSEVRRCHDRIGLYMLMEKHPNWTLKSYGLALNRSEDWVRKWRHRIASAEQLTMDTFLSQSRAPKTRPRQTPQVVKKAIGDLREELSEAYHRKAGSRLIQLKLNEMDDLFEAGYFVPSHHTTVNRILRELGYITPKRKRMREPLVLPPPNDEWEIDFGQIRIDAETILEFFIVVDRGTSRVIYTEGSQGYTAETALDAVARLFKKCGMPQRLRMDRDTRFVGSWTRDSYPSALIQFLRCLGVTPVVCPPRRPDLKPYVETCIGTLKDEWFARHAIKTYADGLEALDTFQAYHNQRRVHFGRACDGRIPDEKFSDLPPLRPLPQLVNPMVWIHDYHQRIYRRRITSNGSIQIDRYTYYVDAQHTKKNVLVYLDAINKQFHVWHGDELLATLNMKGLQPDKGIPFEVYLDHMKQEARSVEMHRLMTWYGIGDVA
jgi:transposase InsO family protein